MDKAKTVDEYVARAPGDVQPKLRQLREIIKSCAPKAEEKISYGMPYYGFKGRLIYFAAQKGYVGIYIPPPIIENHATELKKYVTTKSAIHLPNDEKLPHALIKKLIKARVAWNEGN